MLSVDIECMIASKSNEKFRVEHWVDRFNTVWSLISMKPISQMLPNFYDENKYIQNCKYGVFLYLVYADDTNLAMHFYAYISVLEMYQSSMHWNVNKL